MKLVLRTNTKEYTAETIDFSFGVIEDILDALDLEHMTIPTFCASHQHQLVLVF